MSKSNIKANIVDNALVVSFQSGKEPRVWRMDMGQFLSTALEVKESQGKFTLVIKPGSGSAEEIGAFSDRKDAVEVLESITETMMRGRETHAAPKTGGAIGRFFKFVFKLVLFVLIALAVIIFFLPRPQVNVGDTVTPRVQTGVPVPADQALGE